jgi:AcrR family transcriptional regulator
MGHREALLDGARRCLLERGYARTTARDLVAASGTNLASIGYHFGSKEALLNGAMQQCFDEYIAEITRIVFADPGATPLQRVRASWTVLVSTFEQHRPLMVAFIEALAQAERVPQLRAQLADCYERLRGTVAEMVRASVGELPEPVARQTASFLIAVYDGLQVQWLLDPRRAPKAEELMTALEVALPAALAAEHPDRVGSSSRTTNPPEHCT